MRKEVEVRKELQEVAVRLIGAIAIKDNRNTDIATKNIRKIILKIEEIGKEYRKVTSPKLLKSNKSNES